MNRRRFFLAPLALLPCLASGIAPSPTRMVNLNVQSLDPRAASGAILSNMPMIAATLRKVAEAARR